MTKKVIGSVEVTNNITVKGNNITRTINNNPADIDGNVDINMFTKSEVDNIVSSLPLSRLGTLDYLPLNVSGSFEGATNNHNYKLYPSVMENDGTLVFLRPGTDGSTKGYYYSYWGNARDSSNINTVSTTLKYNPVIIPNGYTLDELYGSDQQVLFGKVKGSTDNKYMIILTNGTMDQTKHTGVSVSETSIRGLPLYACRGKNKIYIVSMNNNITTKTNPMVFYLYSINISDINDGITTSYTDLTATNWTTSVQWTTEYGGNKDLVDTGIRLANNTIESIPSGYTPSSTTSFLLYEPTIVPQFYRSNIFQGQVVIAEDPNNEGVIRLANSGIAWFVSPFSAPTYSWGFSLVANTNTNIATTDEDCIFPIRGYFEDGVVKVESLIKNDYLATLFGLPNMGLYEQPTTMVLKDGKYFTFGSSETNRPTYRIATGNITGFTNYYEYFEITKRYKNNTFPIINTVSKNIDPTYGSPLGQAFMAVQPINTNKLITTCKGTNNSTFFNSQKVSATFGSSGYVYNSITAGTIEGFSPTTNRTYKGNNLQLIAPISYVPKDGSPIRVLGTSFSEDVKLSGFVSMDINTEIISGSISISNSVLVDIKTQILNLFSFGTIVQSKIVLYQIPEDIFSSFAVVYVITDTKSYAILAKITLTTVDNVIISGSNAQIVDTFGNGYFDTNIINAIRIENSLSSVIALSQPGVTIYDADDFVYISVGMPMSIYVPTGYYHFMVTACGDLNTRQFMTASITNDYVKWARGTYSADGNVGVHLCAIPNNGFGKYIYNSSTDVQTKLIYQQTGTNLSHYLGNTVVSYAPKVILSQQVAQNWNVYFTQEVPLMMSGKFFKLPITMIDLQTITPDPSNKTFFISVIMKLGIPQYVIGLSFNEDSNTQLAFGNIVTNSTGIVSISTSKVSRLSTYRPATTNYQHSIPVSTGLPTSTGTRWN